MKPLDEIYQDYSHKVYLFLLGKTANEHLAEELTQETFFQAVQSIHHFQGQSSIMTWLCGIANNLWLKYLRSHKNYQIIDSFDECAYLNSVEHDVLLGWENIEVLKKIHVLKEPIREVMYLRLIGNLSFAQIGEIMGKNENWSRVNFYRGKSKIIKEMEQDE